MFCAKCGQALRDGVNFCEKCGAKVAGQVPGSVVGQVRVKLCGNCGSSVTTNSKICKWCGSNLK